MRHQLATAWVRGVRVQHWNPHRPISQGRIGRYFPLAPRPNNFGDLLGPYIVRQLSQGRARTRDARRLLTVGSILHLARSGDVIWGSGVNGKIDPTRHRFKTLDVRAVRGPLTRSFLMSRGITVPEVFGDPALLVPNLHPRVREWSEQKVNEVLVVPNLHDRARVLLLREEGKLDESAVVLDPGRPIEECLMAIAQSKYVISSSLHGLIIAESLAIPAIPVRAAHEDPFKYEDYLLGTGRSGTQVMGRFESRRTDLDDFRLPQMDWDSSPLISSFPSDLWKSGVGR